MDDECVAAGEADCGFDLFVVVEQVVSEADDARVSSDHEGSALGSRSADLVEWEEGRSAAAIGSQPLDARAGDLVVGDDDTVHAAAQSEGECLLVSGVLGC